MGDWYNYATDTTNAYTITLRTDASGSTNGAFYRYDCASDAGPVLAKEEKGLEWLDRRVKEMRVRL